MQKTIGIDARFYGPLGKGLGRYAKEVIDRLLEIDQTNHYVIFLSPGNFDAFRSANPNVKKVLVKYRWYTLAEQLFFPWLIWRERIDLMHFLHFNVPVFCPSRYVVTIHDLILINHPTARATTLGPLKYRLKNAGYRLVIWLAIARARKVISVSEFTRQDILSHFKVQPDKIVVTYEGVAQLANKVSGGDVLAKYGITQPFLLYIGNAYPHKNLEGLIDGFAKLYIERPQLRLVLVGREDYFYARVKEYARGKGLWQAGAGTSPVVFTDFVPDDELSQLYQSASLYVFASFYEGFGLPPLEAMAHGLAVLCSNRASLPEVLGEAAYYFDPEDTYDLVSKASELLERDELRAELQRRGYEQVKKYNWDECARQTLEAYS